MQARIAYTFARVTYIYIYIYIHACVHACMHACTDTTTHTYTYITRFHHISASTHVAHVDHRCVSSCCINARPHACTRMQAHMQTRMQYNQQILLCTFQTHQNTIVKPNKTNTKPKFSIDQGGDPSKNKFSQFPTPGLMKVLFFFVWFDNCLFYDFEYP